MMGILKLVNSLVNNELIIGPGFASFSSMLAANTKTLILCSSSINFLSS